MFPKGNIKELLRIEKINVKYIFYGFWLNIDFINVIILACRGIRFIRTTNTTSIDVG